VSAAWTVTTPLTQNPRAHVHQAGGRDGPVAAGDHVTFTFLVTNNGQRDPELAHGEGPDARIGHLPGDVDGAWSDRAFAPVSPYTVTDADAARGWIRNTAVASVLGAELETGLTELTVTSTATVITTKPAPEHRLAGRDRLAQPQPRYPRYGHHAHRCGTTSQS